jgi:hypothetical protein
MSHISVVSILTRLCAKQPRNSALTPCMSKRLFPSPDLPERLWGPPSLLLNEYPGPLFLETKRSGGESDHSPLLVPKLRMIGAVFLFTQVP